MKDKIYKIKLVNGKYLFDYQVILMERRSFLGLFNYWWGVNFVRGERSLVEHMAARWCERYNVDRTEDLTS